MTSTQTPRSASAGAGVSSVIRLGIVGCNYGRSRPVAGVSRRSALRGRRARRLRCGAHRRARARRGRGARASDAGRSLSSTRTSTRSQSPRRPSLQPAIAVRALDRGKPVFVEKPLAADLDSAAAMLRQAAGGPPAMIDFGFPEIPPWQQGQGAARRGRDRRAPPRGGDLERRELRDAHCACGAGRRARPTAAARSAISSATRSIIWNGSAARSPDSSARLSGLADDPALETTVALSVAFRSGAVGNLVMSSASYLGSGHRLEFYGEDGTLVLANPTPDYMRGFELLTHAGRRPRSPRSRSMIRPTKPPTDASLR